MPRAAAHPYLHSRLHLAACLILALSLHTITPELSAQTAASRQTAQMVIIDTDIGDDIDDVFAVGLALNSPELKILGITSAWGDTKLRARLLDRLLRETGRTDIPVAVGVERHTGKEAAFSQAAWARRQPESPHPGAVDFLLEQIRRYPGEITLIAIAPETNLAAALARDPATFRKLKRIVIMGGSIRLGYDDQAPLLLHPADPEYNIAMDVPAAQAVFTSGIPLDVMPLDSTQLKLTEALRGMIFTASTPLADATTLLFHQWSSETRQSTPTMFDAVAVAFAIDPKQCPVMPLHLEVDREGYTRETPGPANANVCLTSDSDSFFRFYMPRFLRGSTSVPPPSSP